MKASDDLGRLDRLTLRTWRIANLVGWWFVGFLIANGLGILLSRTVVQKIAYWTVGWQAMAASVLLSVFTSATAGWIVGSHVYRSPSLVALASILFPFGVLFIVTSIGRSPIEVGYVVALTTIPCAVAAVAARLAWRRRPSALRASG
jgi:hypothetical protein